MGNALWVLPFMGALAGVGLLPLILGTVLHPEIPTAVVISRSMWPALNRGDVVFIKETTREEIEVGTVLIFRRNNGITIHRVIRLDGDTIVTKGDANTREDDPITFDDVVGVNPVWFGRPAMIPYVGRLALAAGPQVAVTQDGEPAPGPPDFSQGILNYAKSPLGLVFMVLVPGILLATAFFRGGSYRTRGGRKLSRMHQRRLERLRKRWPKARLA